MQPVATEIIVAAVEILGADGISEDDIESKIGALVPDPLTVQRLLHIIPEAFGLVLISHLKHLGEVRLPSTFSVKTATGKWQKVPMKSEPIFPAAIALAQHIFHNGPRSCFRNIVVRSALLGCVNNALNEGISLAKANLAGPALLTIPAELYSEKPS